MKFLKSFKKPDIIIILSLLAAAVILSAVFTLSRPANNAVYAEVIYGGNIIYTVYLNNDRVFSVQELPHIGFEVKDGKIAFIESDCPDRICVKTGFISKSDETAACLPNKTVLHITTKDNDTDAIIK